IDDHVPGYDVLVPFFLVSIPDRGSLDTLIALTETGESNVQFRLTVFTPNAVHCFDKIISLTKGDVVSFSLSALLENAPQQCLSSIEVDLDHDGVSDHYAGYVTFENLKKNDPKNQAMGVLYLVNLINGVSAGVNLPSIEIDESLSITDSKLVDQNRHTELFSGNAMYRAQQYIALPFQPSTIRDATYFRLLPRYVLIDSTYHNYWLVWADRPINSGIVIIYDEDGNSISGTLPPLSMGLTIVDFKQIVPNVGLESTPVAGWADLTLSDVDVQLLGYTFLFKFESSNASNKTLFETSVQNQTVSGFGVLSETHRDAGTFD
ncbi:MAG: hypothetical protein LJE96_22970, partial [Deltaproteobacteria bacterium]|nr:hypothetical protein [Deltaproteobacteria bacterium]